ncbi:MAG TPA: FmdB family zinc ribbon protein [Candidatus Limnocylindrales bacterium]|nr:FmdB family zinc ribbon protein [Candidatus Limnocylindrales bacterium]
MPLYDYQCRACSKVTEVRHGFREAYDGTCPECGSDQLARVFNPAGIVFKGSGFYVTDSRKAPASESSSSDSSKAPAAPAPAASTDSGSKKSEASAA